MKERALPAEWHVLVLLLAGLLLCYSAVLVAPYGFYDDYTDLSDSFHGRTWPVVKRIMHGRPTYALLEGLSLPYLSSIGDLRYLRLLGVVGLALLAWSVYRRLVCVQWGSYQALCISIIMCMLPPFQVYAAWAATAFYPFAAVISGVAFSLAQRSFDEDYGLYKWSLVGRSILLLLLALTIHQSVAMFFWVFVVIGVLTPDASFVSMRRRFLWCSGIVLSALLLGFGVYQGGMAIYSDGLTLDRSQVTLEVGEKVYWFLRWPLMNALNLANIFPRSWFALSVASFIVSGLMLSFGGACKERLSKLMIALCILPLSYLPNLVVAENWSSYRTQSALVSVIAVYVFLAFRGYLQIQDRFVSRFLDQFLGRFLGRSIATPILAIGLGIMALGSSLLAAHNVRTYFISPQLQELTCIRSKLAQKDIEKARSIYLISGKCQDSTLTVRYDEFGSSSSFWASKAMVYVLLREMNPKYTRLPIAVVSADEPITPPSDALVVDLRT